MLEKQLKYCSPSTTTKAIMDDLLASQFESLMIRNQPEETNEITESFIVNEILNDSQNDNRIKSPSKDKNLNDSKNENIIISEIEDVFYDFYEQEYDEVDHQAIAQCDEVKSIDQNLSLTNKSISIHNSSDLKTPEQINASFKKQAVRSSPRLNPNKDETGLDDNKVIKGNISATVATPPPSETPYHTPKSEEDETDVRKISKTPVWMTPQNKSRHQKRRINIKDIPEVIPENYPYIATSTPFKSCDVLPDSPGLENIYPKVVSPSVNEQSYTSLRSGYSSSEDVLSAESSICSTSSTSKSNVSFGIAKVYCFDRCFGIDTVPDEGNFSLGMSQVAWEAIERPIYDCSEEMAKSMQKLTIDQRRILLEESCGSVELDKAGEEHEIFRSPEIEVIRSAREQVGCRCIGACNPATCECALSEIECQVERTGWPCGCTKLRCKNPEGRRQFQPAKIKKETRIKIMQTSGKEKLRRSV